MRMVLLLAILVTTSTPAIAQVYKWVDDKGTVHFSDKPASSQGKAQEMRSVTSTVSPDLRLFCTRLRALMPRMLGEAQYGSSRAQSMQQAQVDEAKLKELGVSDLNLHKLVDALYAYSNQFHDGEGVMRAVDDIHSRCMAGAYGSFRRDETIAASAKKPEPITRAQAASGTGFLISGDMVATSLHVVDGSRNIQIHLSDGSKIAADTVSMDRSKDLAILKLQVATKLRPLRVASDTVGLGADVFTIGFPQPELMGVEPKLSTGVISSTSGIQDDARTYQISVPVQAGNSGGPLIDSAGRVVGIVASKLNAAKVFEWTGDLPQNVNYAVKSTHLARLMSVDVLRAAQNAQGVGTQAMARDVQVAVVRIEAL